MEDTLVREQELVGTVVGFSLGHNRRAEGSARY